VAPPPKFIFQLTNQIRFGLRLKFAFLTAQSSLFYCFFIDQSSLLQVAQIRFYHEKYSVLRLKIHLLENKYKSCNPKKFRPVQMSTIFEKKNLEKNVRKKKC
jgi:hypothetical protein